MSRSAGGGSSTCVVELQELDIGVLPHVENGSKERFPQFSRRSLTKADFGNRFLEPDVNPSDALVPPPDAQHAAEKWNSDRTTMLRIFACFWSFIVLGANDAALGALIPYLEAYYHLSYTVVSLAFLSPLVGYTSASLLNNNIHHKFGQRGVAVVASTCHITSYVIFANHPPFPVFVVLSMLAGFGSGLEDAGWNAWIGNMANANELLGFLHGAYGLGATISPLIATSLITKAHVPWYYFYYVMIGFAGIEFCTSVPAFWRATGAVFRANHPRTTEAKGNSMKEALLTRPSARITWVCTAFLMVYVGIEVALGGWIVTFMLRVRKVAPFAAGMTSTGFWLGMTIGRVILGFITPKLGENLAIMIYIPITAALELVFWLVPEFYVSAVAVGFQGFFLGPLFPAAIVVVTKLLPKHLHVSAIGFAAAAGGSGAALFPFAVGAIAQVKGVQVLQPIILALLVLEFFVWMTLPKMSRKRE